MSGIQMLMSRNMQTQNSIAYQESLDYTARAVSTITNNIQRLSENILVDKDVQSFINTPFIEKKTLSDMYLWKDVFEQYHLDGFNIQSMHLYSASNNWVIGKGTGSGTAVKMDETMYGVTLGFTGMTYAQWQAFVSAEDPNGFYLTPSGELIYRMNILTTGHRRSIMVIRVNASPISEALHPIALSGGYIAVCDSKGNLILSGGESPFEDTGILCEITANTLDMEYETPVGYEGFHEKTIHGWHIFSFQQSDVLHADVHHLSSQLLMLTLLMLAIDIVLCVILSRNNASPLKHLVSFVSSRVPKEYLENENEYILIENTVAMLLEKNNNYQQLNDEQRELINFELVRCLLMGEYWNMDRMEQLMRHSCLPMENCRYGVIAIPTRHGHVPRADMDRIRKAISVSSEASVACGASVSCDSRALILHDRFVILFFLNNNATQAQWMELTHALAAELNSVNEDIPFQLCISDLHDSREQIHTAYDETVAMIEIIYADSENTAQEIHFSGLSSTLSETWYDYPIDMELQIIHALKAGNTALLVDLLNEVRVRNYSERKLSASMSRQLMFEVRGTVIRGLQPWLTDTQIDRHVRAMCQANTLDSLFQHVEDISVEMAEILHAENDRSSSDLEDRIYAFLSDNYTNANLTLQDLAEPMGRSERFLYDFIRERFNSSFSKLLEGLRITKACALLRDGEANIKNVACQVGYNSDHTFRLAFKRVMNVTPSEYAAAHAHSNSEM